MTSKLETLYSEALHLAIESTNAEERRKLLHVGSILVDMISNQGRCELLSSEAVAVSQPTGLDPSEWKTEEMPELGSRIEMVLASGEILIGKVTQAENRCLHGVNYDMLICAESMSSGELDSGDDWWTNCDGFENGLAPDEHRVMWRYLSPSSQSKPVESAVEWHYSGTPELGRRVEIELESGETLIGEVIEVDSRDILDAYLEIESDSSGELESGERVWSSGGGYSPKRNREKWRYLP